MTFCPSHITNKGYEWGLIKYSTTLLRLLKNLGRSAPIILLIALLDVIQTVESPKQISTQVTKSGYQLIIVQEKAENMC